MEISVLYWKLQTKNQHSKDASPPHHSLLRLIFRCTFWYCQAGGFHVGSAMGKSHAAHTNRKGWDVLLLQFRANQRIRHEKISVPWNQPHVMTCYHVKKIILWCYSICISYVWNILKYLLPCVQLPEQQQHLGIVKHPTFHRSSLWFDLSSCSAVQKAMHKLIHMCIYIYI